MHLAHVVGPAVKRRVDVDELDLAAKAVGQQVGQHIFVVAVVEQAALGQIMGPVAPVRRMQSGGLAAGGVKPLDGLRWVSAHAGQGLFAHPGEHGAALGLGDGDVFGLLDVLGHGSKYSGVRVRSDQVWGVAVAVSISASGFKRRE